MLERACAAVAGGFAFERVGIVRYIPETSTLLPFAGHGLTPAELSALPPASPDRGRGRRLTTSHHEGPAMMAAMRGTMIWFNADKGHGFIRTEEDERLIVHADGFTDGEPVGRCAGNDVSFDRETVDGEARAVNVSTVPLANARRARRRGY